MHNPQAPVPAPSIVEQPESLASRIRAAAALLEEIVTDRAILADVPVEDRNRFLQAAGQVSRPDVIDRRRLLKVSKRRRKAERVKREESVLAADRYSTTASRSCLHTRRTTFHRRPSKSRRTSHSFVRLTSPSNCYVCKQHLLAIHHFYDQLCPSCARIQFREAHRARRSARTRRAAHRRSREDRLPGRASSCCARARN